MGAGLYSDSKKPAARSRLNARRPYIVLPLTARHRRAGRDWAKQYQRWNLGQWSHGMFSDESWFMLEFCDGRQRVWRRRGEQYFDAANLPHDRYGGGSVTVWGGVTTNE